ncbi:MAG: hypothetical protein ABSD85_09835 [Acidimicrobiales bacterium]|jgi:hypothetical protein
MDDAFAAADTFLLSQARLLERRLFATCFLGAPASGVVDALRGYQNEDGGFGQALEPDTRCPTSLPVYVESAFQALATAGTVDREMVLRACDYLAHCAHEAGAGGAVALANPIIESFPRAGHWTQWTYEPGLNPTAGLVGLLYQLGVEHPWREDAARYCWEQLESVPVPAGAHTVLEALVFLDHVPERERADDFAARIAAHFEEIPELHLDPETAGYGISPLQFAPTPTSRWRKLFTGAQIAAAIDHMAQSQQSDGGWPLTWEPPSEAATLEWRGVVTLEALRTLVAYGRITPGF